jgi:serine/threonine-protein kinase HipA
VLYQFTKMMKNKCLYCYEPLNGEIDFHKKCSLDFFGTSIPPLIPYSIDQMTELAKDVVERSVTIPGVQAKLSMSLVKATVEKPDSRLTVVGALGGNYIFKPPSEKYPEMPQNEHLTMRIAEAFNISVVPSSLIRLSSGELSYITRRVDRTENGYKIHMLDMFQITEAFDKYKSSMEKVGKALHSYSQNTMLDKIFYFELSLFCFLTGNNDMHLKNFSMIRSASGWVLAPAYDLLNVAIILPDDKEELALTLEGKKKKLSGENFIRLGQKLELTEKQTEGVFKRIVKNTPKAIEWIEKSFLSDDMKTAYKKMIEFRYMQLNITDSKSNRF